MNEYNFGLFGSLRAELVNKLFLGIIKILMDAKEQYLMDHFR
jgi:hypothetical protein